MAEIRSTVTHESAEPPDELEVARQIAFIEVARQIAFILDRGRRLLAERRAREPVGIEDKLPPAVSTRATPATTSTKADGNLEVGQLGPGGRFIVSPRGSETAVSFFTKRDHAVAFAEAHGGLALSQPPASARR